MPSKRRESRVKGQCPCTSSESGAGICDLDVWLGTTVDGEAARTGQRMLRPNLPVARRNRWSLLRFPGHLYPLVSMNWALLLSVFVGAYVGVVGVFALLFAACHGMNPDSTANSRNYFNLSLQTLSTIGFGSLYPANDCSGWISIAESFTSMLLTSFLTGIAFVKFARPHPNIMFSDVVAVSRGESGLEMRFRVANEARRDFGRRGDIIDVSFELILMRVEIARHGEPKLCYYELQLETPRLISMRLDIELIHTIDASSPFFNRTLDNLAHEDFVMVLIVSGLDENLHDTIHTRREYGHEAMKWGAKFQPMLDWDTHHKFVELDLNKISTVVSAPIDGDEDQSIDVVVKSPTQRDDRGGIRPLTSSSSRDEIPGSSPDSLSHHSSKTFQVEHRVTDGTQRDLSEDYDQKAFMKRADNSQQSGGKLADVSSSRSGDENKLEKGESFENRERRRSGSWYADHDHQFTDDHQDRPMSLLQRDVRVKHQPRNMLLNRMYQRALAASWPSLLLSLVVVYMAVIAFIALLIFVSIQDPLEQREDEGYSGRYQDILIYCVQTLSTIGYGSLSPRQESDAANFFVFLLVFSGLFVSTVLTGITWAKFSIPESATLLYSDVLLITTFHSHRAIMFRAANDRKYGVLVEGSFRMSIVVLNRNLGRRETHELQLVRNVWPIINLCNTVTHIIDESSPLYNVSTSDLLSGDNFFFVLFTGLDNVINDTMVARKAYHACDMLVDHHFKDSTTLTTDGLHIDMDSINATYCESDTSRPSEEEDRASFNGRPDAAHSNYALMS